MYAVHAKPAVRGGWGVGHTLHDPIPPRRCPGFCATVVLTSVAARPVRSCAGRRRRGAVRILRQNDHLFQ